MNPFESIDDCAPWPDHPAGRAQILRETINDGIERLSDEAADVVGVIADEMALAAVRSAGPFSCPDTHGAWIGGAAYAFAVMLGHLQHEMPLPRLQELIEDIADDVAPDWEGDDE